MKMRLMVGVAILVATGLAQSASSQTLTTIYTFCPTPSADLNCPDGSLPNGGYEISPGLFLGACDSGGTNGDGTVFTLTSGGVFNKVYQFTGPDGAFPNFRGQSVNGVFRPIQGSGGTYYGTTSQGGAGDSGTVFRITAQGTLTTVYNFSGPDGSSPANMVAGSDGNFYGATDLGGSQGSGTVYKITSAGTLTTLHDFAGLDGGYPNIVLQNSSDNQFYGSALLGGTNGVGTIFKITSAGTLTTLHTVNPVTEGANPSLTIEFGGNLYGTLLSGGSGSQGTVFELTAGGSFTNLYGFSGPDGAEPVISYRDANGTFYGTTSQGGANGGGAVFKLTAQGTLTTLYTFCSDPDCADGSNPGGIFLASDGLFYGPTGGGPTTNGTIFSLNAGVIPTNSCTYALSQPSAAFTAGGGTGSFSVMTSNNCDWTSASNAGFITITAGASGTGNGAVNYTVAANSSTNSLTGTITVADQTLTVIEAGVSNFVPTKIIGLTGPLTFGTVTTGTTATATLTIANSGNATLTVNSISYPDGFSGAFSGVIAAGGSTNATVTFAPTAVTNYSGTVAVTSDATSGTASITATGTGVAAVLPTRIIGVSPATLAFGNVETSLTATVFMTITNSGDATLTVTNIGYPGEYSGATTAVIPAGSSTNIAVTFAPTSLAIAAGAITVASDATGGINTINVSGTGVAISPVTITKTTATVNFAKANSDSATVNATLAFDVPFTANGAPVTVNIGGAQLSFTLKKSGTGTNGKSSVHFSYVKKTNQWKVTASLKDGSYQADWLSLGFTDATIKKPGNPVVMPVQLTVNGQVFAGNSPTIHYTATEGKTGTAK